MGEAESGSCWDLKISMARQIIYVAIIIFNSRNLV